ncbi:MAG: DUF975 family protein [Clostridium butyricum]|nr:DUF975 family protein [Clostridium butyricum]
MERSVLKSNAKNQLKGKWGIAVIAFLIGIIISSIFVSIDNFVESGSLKVILKISNCFVTGAMSYGLSNISLNFANNDEVQISDIFAGFNRKVYLKILGLSLLVSIIVIIGIIFFIVPGIILALRYSQVYFILIEDNDKGVIECMKESAEMMKGHKWEFFVLQLSFILWVILSIITFGIALLWVTPYISVTYANYYKSLSNNEL